jgi:hypothetical protein
LVKTEECSVVQVKTKDNTLRTVRLVLKVTRKKKLKKSGTPYRYLKEFRGDINEIKNGRQNSLDIFEPGDRV